MQDIKAPCDSRFTAAHDSGPRKASDIGWIVIHSTEGDTATGAAAWFQNPESAGSANLVVDDENCFRTVADLRVPWAAPPLNTKGFHIECAGYAAWTTKEWLAHSLTLRRAAYKAALRADLYGIPVRRVGWVGLRLGRRGFTDHASVSKAWKLSDHHDPGPNFPWKVFLRYVDFYRLQLWKERGL